MQERDFAQLFALVEDKQYRTLKLTLSEMNQVDAAAFMEELNAEKAVIVFRTLSKTMAAEVFAEFSSEMQEYIINSISDQELGIIVEDLFLDDAVDMLEELPANVVTRVLKNAKPETRARINQFLKYEEDSAGSKMTSEFIELRKNMTVSDAFLKIRRTAFDRETIYICYVTDAERHLEGVVSIKTLFLSDETATLAEIMDTDLISVTTSDDQEYVAGLFTKYGFVAIPVVDIENRLVGIITVDDAVEVITEEATEDFHRMAAMAPSDKPYLKTSVLSLSKNRIVWLLVLMISAMVTGSVLQNFEHAFAALPLLVTFIPMLTDTGGNAGAQSSTLIIRGMAVSEIKTSDFLAVLWKELRVSLLVGLGLSVVNYIRLIIMYPGNELVALTVVISLYATVIIAKTVGSMLPIIAKLLKADPAIMAAPLITTIVDAVSLVIYFSIAQRLLQL